MDGPKAKAIIELKIESLAFGGKGVAHLDGFTVFVDRGLPGQKVKARITRKKENYAEAVIIEVVSHSLFEVAPQCPYFGTCGGCLFQNLDYNEQLNQKRRQVKESLEYIGGFKDIEVLPTLPSPEIYYYRNKMEFSFSRLRWLTNDEIQSSKKFDRDFALGLHVPKYYDKVLDIDQCFLLSERSNQILRLVKDFARQSDLLPYTTVNHSGFWRFLVIRESKRLDQMMVDLVTADHASGNEVIQSLARLLARQFPFIRTIVHNISRKKTQVAYGDVEHVIFGSGYIEELLGSRKYRISANSFFQTSTLQAEKLYQLIVDWGQFRKDQKVYDLYSGIGGIAIYIANQVKKVVGFELIPQAIDDAKVNCKINSIDNCHFIEGDLKDNLANPLEIVEKFGQPSVIIIDPPRSGLHPKLPKKILQLKSEKIIYVSCNPATLARDLSLLCRDHFKIISVQPVDMFPHTVHCEVVVLLES
ncbi:MAG: 23S rRNA (uracil(1939)-C(5))-methyltransferase RlmD [bacterium]|nr:MAG: 23S rRNA (uracil(1939)-C(5))-methyltransferase RlmD [bacterium]